MIQRSVNLLFGSSSAEFESAFPLQESIERLRAATKRTIFGALSQESAVGKVTEERVSLFRVIPFWGNSFAPFFVGSFRQVGNRVLLTGRFTMHWLVKVFSAIWFGGILYWTITAFVIVSREASPDWLFPLFGVGMLVAGILFLLLCKWFARNDPEWLSGVIRGALSKE